MLCKSSFSEATIVGQEEARIVDSLIQEYQLNVDSTKQVKLKSHLSDDTRVYEVEHSSPSAYIIDTPMTRRIACHPYVVGEELEELASRAAEQALPAILELSGINQPRKVGEMVFEQILRAAPGYQLHRAATKLIPDSFKTVHIRPRYTHTSYRDHDGMVQRQLNIVYEDFSSLPRNSNIFLIMQDTVASSRSAEISFETAISRSEKINSKIMMWILYGFISSEGLTLLDKIAKSHGVPLIAFAMGNLTALCANNYDMPLYGVDEWLWRRNGSIHKLGALVDRTTLVDYVKELVPGSDQPGDWSARQTRLSTGKGYEDGNISEHLENSIRLIKSLREIGNFTDWQEQLARTELRMLEAQLAKAKPRMV
jgi:hypothetical protein